MLVNSGELLSKGMLLNSFRATDQLEWLQNVGVFAVDKMVPDLVQQFPKSTSFCSILVLVCSRTI